MSFILDSFLDSRSSYLVRQRIDIIRLRGKPVATATNLMSGGLLRLTRILQPIVCFRTATGCDVLGTGAIRTYVIIRRKPDNDVTIGRQPDFPLAITPGRDW
jgi:hypothetical protein